MNISEDRQVANVRTPTIAIAFSYRSISESINATSLLSQARGCQFCVNLMQPMGEGDVTCR